ncbi:MAG: hypothetical protein NC342_05735 [Pseudoflavonifractor sp.]|nr:hypothetical protein [Alloprevotella sp.]MCM1117017.1 hypothetical protein [Pseudoflavonifractor sp.]
MRNVGIIIACLLALVSQGAKAQYYELANQLPQLITPALSGSLNYKGFVEATGTAGVGENRANDLSVTTSQGFQYSSWFFMGVGVGIDVLMAGGPDYDSEAFNLSHGWSDTKAMLPLFSDFRFNIGSRQSTSLFIDLKIGAAWLLGNSNLGLSTGLISSSTQFFLRPSIGIRFPISRNNPNQALNVGATYQLITSGSNYSWRNNSISLNNFGASIAFEW